VHDVVALVVTRAGILALGGLLAGTAAAFLLCGALRGFVFGIAPTDPATWVSGIAVLAAVALIAAWLPARRAGRVDPLVVLRSD